MLHRLSVRQHVRHLSLLVITVILLLVLSNLNHATAALGSFKTLDDTQADFASGSFQRTAISSGTSTAFNDGDGLLQLAAVGTLKPWGSTTSLPIPLGKLGVTTIGNRLYTVGGASTNQPFVDSVFWATTDQATGAFPPHDFTETTKPTGSNLADAYWINDPLLPTPAFMSQAPHLDCTTEVIQGRSAPAVASLVTGANTGYIYAIGGAFQPTSTCSTNPLTSPVVQIGTVIANGDISWQSTQANYLPSQDLSIFEDWASPTPFGLDNKALGVQGATASILRTRTGTAYLYVIGGRIIYHSQSRDGAMVTPAVFYTRLNQSTGALEYPLADTNYYIGSPWVRTTNVPVNAVYSGSAPNPGDLGLYDHTAMVSRATVSSTTATTTTEAIFVTGGYTTYDQNVPSAANQAVFRAIANEATGALQWETQLNPPSTNTVSTDVQRGNPGGFAYGGKLYVIGGVPTNSGAAPVDTVSTALHDDSLNILPLFPGTSSEYFIGGNDTKVINNPVSGLGAAVIQAVGATNAAWGYAIGGFDASNAPTTQIYRGAIGGEDVATATKRAPEGWYYSRFHNIQLGTDAAKTEARVLSIRWSTIIDRAPATGNPYADLTIQFRRTRILPCDEAAFVNSPWMTLDADGGTSPFNSIEGIAANRVEFKTAFPTEDSIATCFQYRVALTQNGNTGGVPNAAVNASVSPKLYKVEIETSEPYDPDLMINNFEIGPNANGQIETFDLKIVNFNGSVANTVAADVVEFPVVLCVAYSATDPNVPLVLPTLPITTTGGTNSRVDCAWVYRWIPGSWTTPGQVLWLNGRNGWHTNFANIVGNLPADELVNVPTVFNTPGYYAVAAMIDPFGVVAEGGGGKANNRGENLNNDAPLIRRFQIKAIQLDPEIINTPTPDPPVPDVPPVPTTATPSPSPTTTPTATPTPDPNRKVNLPLIER